MEMAALDASNGAGEVLPTQESVEQSVATLMGEIGKHIEGQFQAVAAAAAGGGARGSGQGGIPVTSTTTSEGDEPEKGMDVYLCNESMHTHVEGSPM